VWAAAAILSAAAAVWLPNGFHRLLSDVDWLSAYDVKLRHEEVARWFAGMPIYEEMRDAIYPPASYAELWPLLGWLDLAPARWLWAAACAAALLWLALQCGRHAVPAASNRVRAVAALVPAALWSTGHSIGQGQLVVLVLPAILTGVHWAVEAESWGQEVASALLVLFALVKPSLTAPFFWILVVARRRVAALGVLGYAGLTLLATSYQDASLSLVLRGWMRRGLHVAALQGDADLATALAAAGWQRWILPATLAVLALHGLWTWRHRRADPWLLLGMSGVVARLWTYHYPYDDLILLAPVLALARTAASARDRLAGGLALVAVATLVLPPVPGSAAILSAPLAAWLAVEARRQVAGPPSRRYTRGFAHSGLESQQ
jgi:glycosyl transferase family 87